MIEPGKEYEYVGESDEFISEGERVGVLHFADNVTVAGRATVAPGLWACEYIDAHPYSTQVLIHEHFLRPVNQEVSG